jgi:hypothetical protein
MKKTMALMVLLAGGMFAAPRVTIGIGFGAPAPVVAVRPACPGPGYTWVDGYYTNGAWVAGYWQAPVAVQVAPRYERRPVFVDQRVAHDRFDNDHFDHDRGDHDRGDHDRGDHDRFRR